MLKNLGDANAMTSPVNIVPPDSFLSCERSHQAQFSPFWGILAPSLSGAGMKYIFKIKTEGCCRQQSLAPEEWNNS